MKLRLGSRKSPLAVAQAEWVAGELEKKNPGLQIEFVRITTSGDRDQKSSLSSIGGKGVFVKEIEEALLKGTIDLAVHSLKDVPQMLPYGLELGPFPLREDARDALLSKEGKELGDLPVGAVIGTSSPRRKAQILYRYKSRRYQIEDLRGNLETRVQKLQEGHFDAIILAVAGLKRLGLDKKNVTQILEPEEMMPAPGQGCLALEHRLDDTPTKKRLASIRHGMSDRRARAERAFLQGLGGNCLVPVGAYVDTIDKKLRMQAILLDAAGTTAIEVEEVGDPNNPELVGAKCAGRLIYEGGTNLL